MSVFSDFMVRVRALFFRNAEDREMDDEVRFTSKRRSPRRMPSPSRASWIPGQRAARIRPIEAIGSGN